MAAKAGGCRPIWGCGGVGLTLAFFSGGWPCSGGGEKREPSARCDRNVAGTYRAAVITGIRGHVSSPANARHTASEQGTFSYPRGSLCRGTNLAVPKWALRASLTAAVVMVYGFKPETSMIHWQEARELIRASGGGGGGRGRICHRPRGGYV